MSQSIELNTIETRAFRSVHLDGLQDIYIGGVLLSMSVMADALYSEPFPFWRFLIFLGGLLICQFLYRLGRRRLTGPRLGQVRFNPQRQQRKRIMTWLLAGIILLQVLVLISSILLWANPQWVSSLGLSNMSINSERLLVASISALFAGVGTLVPAYFNEYLRGYYISLILAVAVFAMIYAQQPVYLVIAGLLVILPGVVILARFLHDHPLTQVEV